MLCGGKMIVHSPKKHLIVEQIVEQLLNLLEMNAGIQVMKSPPQEFVKIEESPH